MKELTKAEEQVMQILWDIEKGFVKDVLAKMEEPKPAYNTVSTIIRILEKKGFVGYKAYGKTHEVAKGQFVELEREGEDPVWTVLGEFADYPHNSIPEPDRSVDNTTIWTADFNQDYYDNMLYGEGEGVNSMRQYYIEQSSLHKIN